MIRTILLISVIITTVIASESSVDFSKLVQKSLKEAYISRIRTDNDTANFNHSRDGEFQWHATIVVKYSYDYMTPFPFYYSGFILNERWIIAPAHIIATAYSIRVDVGSVNISDPLVSVYPDAYTLHPKFNNKTLKNNIALLQLTGENTLDFTSIRAIGKFAPIDLPRKSQIEKTFLEGEHTAFVSGFAFVNPNGYGLRRISQSLLFAKQEIISNRKCATIYEHNENGSNSITSNVICTKNIDMKAGHCIGDAGSPLIINENGKNILIGFLSDVQSDGSCDPRFPAIFERITGYYDWIEQVTGYLFTL